MTTSTQPTALRQGYVCPDCGCIKDGWDVERGKIATSRWCWNLHAHKRRRKMRPTALWRYIDAKDQRDV